MTRGLSEQELNSLRAAAYQVTRAATQARFDSDVACKLSKKLGDLADRSLKQAADSGAQLVCKPGCNYCCHRCVLVGLPEAWAIFSHLVQTWPGEKLEALKIRLRDHWREAKPQRAKHFWNIRTPCPMLQGGLCSIYDRRPLLCRSAASIDADICKSYAETTDPRVMLPSPNGEVGLGKTIAGAMVQALGEAGLTTQALPLSGILWALLDNNREELQALYSPDEDQFELHLTPKSGDPPGIIHPSDPALDSLKEQRQSLPLGPILANLPKMGARYLLAKITAPRVFESERDVSDWMEQFECAIDNALKEANWNPHGAFNSLPNVAILNAGYAGYSMHAPMTKLGRLFQDRIAALIAPDLLQPLPVRKEGRIRVGFASINLYNNSGGSWVPGWLRNLEKSEFETFLLKFGPPMDGYTFMMQELADHFYLFNRNPLAAARFIKGLDLDYLIFPALADPGLNYQFAVFRLARRQGLAWGCPFTSGLPQIDDYLSANLMEPESAEAEYSENLVRLPGSGMTYYRFPQGMGPKTRSDLGLPKGHLVTYTQNLSKWLPRHDEMLSEIIRQSGNPLLAFRLGTPYAIDVFEKRMERVKAPVLWLDVQEPNIFHRIVESCDVSIDAPEWSGGHTSFYTLQFRTPVLTMPGKYMRGRMSYAYNKIVGAPEMITSSPDEYIRVSQNRELLQHVRNSMNPDALFDDVSPVRALENHIRGALSYV